MASGGWEFSTASGKLQGKISWSSSSNGSSANTSNITATLYARRVDGYTTTGQSWSGYVKIQGKDNSNQTNISFSSSVSVGSSWVQMAQVTLTGAKHNDDGSGSATVSGSVTGPSGTGLAGITSSGSSGITLDKIARYTSIKSFTVSKRDETSLTFGWQTADTIDYVWYSTNNGSSYTGYDVTDGTSGSFNVTDLSAGTPYTCKLRVRRKDSQLTTDSAAVTTTTNSLPTTTIASRTETTATINWTSDGTSNYIWYAINDGSWVGVGSVNASSGSYTISSGLSAGGTYNIKTIVRKSNTSGQYASANKSVTMYNYPYCTSAPNFTIGNNVSLSFYNPLNRSIQLQMWSHVSQTFINSTAITTSGTSYTFPASSYNTQLYNSIPSATKSRYNIDVWYGDHKEVFAGGEYSIASSVKPSFGNNNFSYKDVGTSALTTAIANNQVIVQGVSNVNLVISSANKMTPSTGAAACTSSNSRYVVAFDNLSKTQAYNDNDIDVNLGVPTGNGNKAFNVSAYDARGTYTTATKTVNIIEYKSPEVNVTLDRLNGFETSTTFSVAGTFSKVTVSNTDKNQISTVRYRLKESTSSTWGSWTTMTILTNSNGSYSTDPITLDCDNEKQFDFQFEVTDLARTVTVSKTLSIGQALMFLHSDTGDLDVQRNINAGGTTISKVNIRPQASLGNNEPNGAGWYKVCQSTMSGYGNTNIMWIVANNYAGGYKGLLNLEMRSNNGSIQCWNLSWIARSGFPANSARLVINGNTWTLYFYRHTDQYGRITFHELIENNIDAKVNQYPITYYNSTTKESTEPTATNTSVDGFTVNHASSAGPGVLKIEKDGAAGKGLTNSSGNSIIRDHNNNNVTVDATGGKLYLGYENTTGINILNGKTNIETNGMIRGAQAGSWVKDRDNSLVRNAYNGNGAYAPVICQGTKTGSWTVGCLSGEDSLTFNFETDTKYNNNDNTANRWTIDTNGNYSGKALNVTQVKSLSSKSHSNYGTNNGYLPDMSFIAYWNGAYNSGGNSNLTYAHQGVIQCKPTSLYDNNTGTTGTITLSQTVANFTYVDVFYSKNGDTAFQSVRVYTGHTNNLNSISCITGYLMNGSSVQINATIIKLSGTSLTHVYNGGVNLYTNPSIGVFTGNELQIKKVVGWKC